MSLPFPPGVSYFALIAIGRDPSWVGPYEQKLRDQGAKVVEVVRRLDLFEQGDPDCVLVDRALQEKDPPSFLDVRQFDSGRFPNDLIQTLWNQRIPPSIQMREEGAWREEIAKQKTLRSRAISDQAKVEQRAMDIFRQHLEQFVEGLLDSDEPTGVMDFFPGRGIPVYPHSERMQQALAIVLEGLQRVASSLPTTLEELVVPQEPPYYSPWQIHSLAQFAEDRDRALGYPIIPLEGEAAKMNSFQYTLMTMNLPPLEEGETADFHADRLLERGFSEEREAPPSEGAFLLFFSRENRPTLLGIWQAGSLHTKESAFFTHAVSKPLEDFHSTHGKEYRIYIRAF